MIYSFTSCSKEKDKPEKNVIYPLAVGNLWTYIDSIFVAFPQENPIDTIIVDTISIEIIGKFNFQLEDKEYTAFIEYEEPYNIKWLYGNENDGCYSYGRINSEQDTIIFRCIHFKYPVSEGDEWFFHNADENGVIMDTISFKCLSINEQFKTPSGNYNCVVYTWDFYEDETILERLNLLKKLKPLIKRDYDLGIKLYFMPNIGWVGATVENIDTNEINYKRVLDSYYLEGKSNRKKYPTSNQFRNSLTTSSTDRNTGMF